MNTEKNGENPETETNKLQRKKKRVERKVAVTSRFLDNAGFSGYASPQETLGCHL